MAVVVVRCCRNRRDVILRGYARTLRIDVTWSATQDTEKFQGRVNVASARREACGTFLLLYAVAGAAPPAHFGAPRSSTGPAVALDAGRRVPELTTSACECVFFATGSGI
jgi:hypothetical protein